MASSGGGRDKYDNQAYNPRLLLDKERLSAKRLGQMTIRTLTSHFLHQGLLLVRSSVSRNWGARGSAAIASSLQYWMHPMRNWPGPRFFTNHFNAVVAALMIAAIGASKVLMENSCATPWVAASPE